MTKLKLSILTLLLFSTLAYSKAIGPKSFSKTIKNNRAVLVKFWASWCGPCSVLKPEFEKAKDMVGKKVLFATYNTDLQGRPLSKYSVRSIPTMILFVDGKEVDRRLSVYSAEDIANWVLSYTSK